MESRLVPIDREIPGQEVAIANRYQRWMNIFVHILRSLGPMVTVTESIGGGFSVDATLNIESANYIGNVDSITRSMMQTSTPSGDIPTFWGTGGIAAGGKIGVTGYITPNVGGSLIIGRELNLGVGLPAGPFPFNGAGGVSNTWILYDFY